MKFKKTIFISIFCLLPLCLLAQDISLIQKIRQSPELQKQLQVWLMQTIQIWQGENIKLHYPADSLFQKPLAVFVTAKKNGEVRGCVGTLLPREKSLADEILKNLKMAFSQDPRHRPIQKDEVPGMEIYISALSSPKLLSKPYQINPARDAILMRSGSKEALALPGEAKTLRYLIAFLKAKAGLRNPDPYLLYRLQSESVGVIMPPVSFE